MVRNRHNTESDAPCSAGENTVVDSPIRIGLVGCGRLAERGYIPTLRQAAGVRLVAVADVNQARCQELAPPGVRTYPSTRSLVDTGGVDALIVATPTRFHLADARVASDAGLPLLLEKPPGVDTAEAVALAGLKPLPWVGFNRRFDPLLTDLRANLPADSALDLRLEIHYRRKAWNPIDMRDDVLLDLGPHLIDLVRWLTGSAIEHAQVLSLSTELVMFRVRFTRGSATIRCSVNRPYTERIEVRDSRRRIIARSTRGGVVSGILARLHPHRKNPLLDSLVRQVEAFACAVRGETNLSLATALDGVAVMACIDAVRRSAVQGGAVCSVMPSHSTQGVSP